MRMFKKADKSLLLMPRANYFIDNIYVCFRFTKTKCFYLEQDKVILVKPTNRRLNKHLFCKIQIYQQENNRKEFRRLYVKNYATLLLYENIFRTNNDLIQVLIEQKYLVNIKQRQLRLGECHKFTCFLGRLRLKHSSR